MEEAQAQSDLGMVVELANAASTQDAQRTPKKRFIGRRAAAERTEKDGVTTGTIEESGTVQGRYMDDLSTTSGLSLTDL